MQNISVCRYSDPLPCGWAGWIEPADKSWILFIHSEGWTSFFPKRDPNTGAVITEEVTS